MNDVTLQLDFLIHHLASGGCVAETLSFPEIQSFAHSPESAMGMLRTLVPALLKESSPGDISQRQSPGELFVESLSLTIKAPREGVYWRDSLPLTFHAVRWARAEGLHLAYVPALQVSAIAHDPQDLLTQLENEIRFALQRRAAASSLATLVELQRAERLEVRHSELNLPVPSPKRRAQDAESAPTEKSILSEVAVDLSKTPLHRAVAIDDTVRRIAEALVGRAARPVLLVGPSGVGKSAAVYELVRQRGGLGLTDRPFWATSGSRLISGAMGFGMWQERCHKLCREAASTHAILYLGNLVELLEVGKSESNALSIAGFLRGYMARGELLAIAECTPEQVAVLERADPHLLATFRQVKIDEPDREVGRTILQHIATETSDDHPRHINDAGIDLVTRLHRRYATYSGFPGRPIRFIRNLLRDQGSEVATPQEITAAFGKETGLPLFMLDDSVPLEVAEARAWFAGRVIAQETASALIADLLATLKAGLNRPRRPIASLLFVGPTGVGKTEMAKAIAEYFFSDRSRLTRFDMSEFNTAESVERLVGGLGRPEGMLTARVRQQPFSVVLFDEVEKAHAAFFDLMLQVLGEGRLTDASGRIANFSNAIVIMTSNLGAASFARPAFGIHHSEAPDAAAHFTEEVRSFFRPELFNRIDRIVPFLPLDGEAIAHIARRELELVRMRDGLRLRELSLDMDDAAARYLAEKGFDPAYGARPLKRAVERELLVPLAQAMNSYAASIPLTATVRVDDGSLTSRIRASGESSKSTGTDTYVVRRAATLRRHFQRLEKSVVLLNVKNEVFRLKRLISREEARRPDHPMLPRWYRRLKLIQGPVERATESSQAAVSLEESLLLSFYDQTLVDREWVTELSQTEQHLTAVLLDLHALRFENPHEVTIAIFGEQPTDLFTLARVYHRSALTRSGKSFVGWYAHDARGLLLHRVEGAAEFLRVERGKPIGLILELESPHVLPLLEGEQGSHLFRRGKREAPALVVVHRGPLSTFHPPAEVHRVGGIQHTSWRREIDLAEKTIDDRLLERQVRWKSLEDSLQELMKDHLDRVIREPLSP